MWNRDVEVEGCRSHGNADCCVCGFPVLRLDFVLILYIPRSTKAATNAVVCNVGTTVELS